MFKMLLRACAVTTAILFVATPLNGKPASAAPHSSSHVRGRLPAVSTFRFAVRPYRIAGKTVNIYIGPPTPYGGFGLATGIGGLLWYTLDGNACCGFNGQIVTMTTSGIAMAFTSSNFSHPSGIVQGPDGNMWFTEEGGSNRLGFITSNGGIGGFPLLKSPVTGPITLGSDKRLWFGIDSEPYDAIAASDTAGNIKQYPLPAADAGFSEINAITVGPDKNTWFSWGRGVGKVTPAGLVTTYNLGFPTNGITTGADGRMWFTLGSATEVGSINTNGTGEVDFQTGITGTPGQIVTGPDKNEYFAEYNPSTGQAAIARLTLSGIITEYALPYGFHPQSIVVGPDKNIWVNDLNYDQLGQLVLSPTGM